MAKIKGTDGGDRLHGRNADDEIFGLGGGDRLAGRVGDDTLRGGGGDDVLIGGQGRDNLYGGAGNDVLRGGSFAEEGGSNIGSDILDGGTGDDKIYGGYLGDLVTGGSGADKFIYRANDDSVFGSIDTITDFEQGFDKLALHGDLRSADAPLHFIGSDAFSGVAGEVRFAIDNGGTVVQIDLDGDAKIDMGIGFNGEIQFQQSDFLF